jgi:hypothetical protein
VVAPSSTLQRGLARLIASWIRDDRISMSRARTLTWKRSSIAPSVVHTPAGVYRTPHEQHSDPVERRNDEMWSFRHGEQPLAPALRALGIDPPFWAINDHDEDAFQLLVCIRDFVRNTPTLRTRVEAMDVASQHLDDPLEQSVLAAIQRCT